LFVRPSGYGRSLSCESVQVRSPEQASLAQANILPRSAISKQLMTAVEDCEYKPQVWEERWSSVFDIVKIHFTIGLTVIETDVSTASQI